MKMRIAEVFPGSYPGIGGTESIGHFLSKTLTSRGHEVHIFALDAVPQKQRPEIVEDEVYIHYVKRYGMWFSPNLIRTVRRFDVVYVYIDYSLLDLYSLQAILASRAMHVPIVVNLVAIGDWFHHPNFFKCLIGSLEQGILLLTIKHSGAMIHVENTRDRQTLVRLGFDEEKIRLIPLGVPDYALNSIDGSSFNLKYGLTDKKIVLFVGRLHYLKGPHVLLRAAPKVIKHIPNAVFVFVGFDAGMKKKLLSMAKSLNVEDHISLTGYVSESTKFEAYAASEVFTLPSLYDHAEAYSLATSEAWTQQKPVIASSVGVMPYRIKHGVNGLLVPPRNPEKLAEAIIEVIENPEMARRLGENGKKEVHTWREVARKMEECFEDARMCAWRK